ncbi:MAG TPA: glycosyltransferase [Candidatus Limnocylindria bacterium]|nr:glycosyltransferase [Candidatus Limnocylindria bacterium]
MLLTAGGYFILVLAICPLAYYLIAIYSAWRFFAFAPHYGAAGSEFTPPVSILKPIRGLDPDSYENFASLCRQDYPDYEILFCVSDRDDPALRVIEELARNFPNRRVRVLFGSSVSASNDKVAKLVRLVAEADHDYLVISDSDVRVRPDYLRSVVAPLADPRVGATTCFYVPVEEKTFADRLQTIGMLSDFYAGILVARQLDGVKFTLGPTIATTRARLSEFGGYAAIENRPADDLLVGRLIAEQGHEVALLPYRIETVVDFHSIGELLHKRLRWLVVMRHMRPWGHFGLLLTQGLPWSLAALAVHPSAIVALAYLAPYFLLRIAMTWEIGVWGLKQRGFWRKMWLIGVWDAVGFFIWIASFSRDSIRWRDAEYRIRDGQLVPVSSNLTDR